MKNTVIIVAGGKGERMSADIPKQFLPIGGKPILMHTIEAFHNYDSNMQIVVALPFEQLEYWQNLCRENHFNINHSVVAGGETRFHSVKNALDTIQATGCVAIHDGVRPFVNTETLSHCFQAAEEHDTAIPVIDVTDTVRFINGSESRTIDRTRCKLVQTPQVFKTSLLKKAYLQAYQAAFTDDASVVENMGIAVILVDGNKENIKITTPFDLDIAEIILKNRH